MAMEHRMDYKNNLREGSARVPLILAPFGVPGMDAAAGRTVTYLTSHIDILPTLLDLAGAPTPPDARGQSLVPLLLPAARGAAAPRARRDFVAAEYHSNLGNTGSFMVRRGDWKLIEFGHTFAWFNATAYVPQLFNVTADPFELDNVAPDNAAVVAALHATLEAEFGGAGALAAIDAAQMKRNYGLFLDVWGNFTQPQLLAAFEKTFTNVSGADVAAGVAAWRAAAGAL